MSDAVSGAGGSGAIEAVSPGVSAAQTGAPVAASESFQSALQTVLNTDKAIGMGTVGGALEMLAPDRATLVVINEKELAAPGVQQMTDALVADGVLARGVSAANPRAYSLDRVTKGISESVRANRPQVERAIDAMQTAGFAGANAALAAMDRPTVAATTPPEPVQPPVAAAAPTAAPALWLHPRRRRPRNPPTTSCWRRRPPRLDRRPRPNHLRCRHPRRPATRASPHR